MYNGGGGGVCVMSVYVFVPVCVTVYWGVCVLCGRHGITCCRFKSVDCPTNICIGVGWAIPPEHNYYDYSYHRNNGIMFPRLRIALT